MLINIIVITICAVVGITALWYLHGKIKLIHRKNYKDTKKREKKEAKKKNKEYWDSLPPEKKQEIKERRAERKANKAPKGFVKKD